jgi:mannose-6-phosphate isomerase-like protein (cupin superfamily)
MEVIERDERPWGYYEVLLRDTGIQIKRIHVNAGNRLSLQTHNHRAEHWFCTSGTGIVTIGEARMDMSPGKSFYIEALQMHRVEATHYDLEFIEVQVGYYLGEDDIVRHSDDYGR